MSKTFHRTFFLDGPAGRLEAMLWTVADPAPARVALVCHPHPLYGGTMHNKVVFQAAKTLQSLGLPVLRFNFRGAGLSAGEHDKGRGERDDVRAALDFLSGEFPGVPIVLAGFSFGSSVGLRVGCGDARVRSLIGLGIPVNAADLSFLLECATSKLFVHGANDEHGARAKVEALFAQMPEPKQLVMVEGGDHFFAGKLGEVDAAIRAWMMKGKEPLSRPSE